MMGRSGYVTELMVDWFGLTNTNWLYGFTGIWLAQVLAFTPMAFMILDGAIKTIHPSLEEASYTLRASRWQTFNGVFVPLLKPALANAFLIVIVQSLADFSNPLVLGGNFDVLATQIYFYITGSQLDYQAASTWARSCCCSRCWCSAFSICGSASAPTSRFPVSPIAATCSRCR
jgi:iron(III) transport system permease protein